MFGNSWVFVLYICRFVTASRNLGNNPDSKPFHLGALPTWERRCNMSFPSLFHQIVPLPWTAPFSHPPIKAPGYLTVHTTSLYPPTALTRVTRTAF